MKNQDIEFLKNTTDKAILYKYLEEKDEKDEEIKCLAAKNLAKLSNIEDIDKITNLLKIESSSKVRRELVSAIGRMRLSQNIPLLLSLTNDQEPTVILQSLRGLMIFKKDPYVLQEILKFSNHPNELINSYIKNETTKFNNKNKDLQTTICDKLKNFIFFGCALDLLKDIEDESIHLTFTSPPYYNAKDYSKYESYDEYLSFLTKVFTEVHRCTKEGRFLVVNTSPVIVARTSRKQSSKRYPIPFDLNYRLMQTGWEFIDDIIWMKPEASVKNRIGTFFQHRKPLTYKPNIVTEYIMVYRKKTNKLIDWNLNCYNDNTIQDSLIKDEFFSSNIWKIDPAYSKEHTAVFPAILAEKVISYYSMKNDLIFDPFAGSGTVGVAANKLNRFFLLSEINPIYFELIKQKVYQISEKSISSSSFSFE